MAFSEEAFNDLSKLVAALSARLEAVEHSLNAVTTKNNELTLAHTDHATSLVALRSGLDGAKAAFGNAIANEAMVRADAHGVLNHDLATLRLLSETRDKDALLLANLSLFYGIMAQEWRVARDRVVAVTTSSTAMQTLSRVGSYSLVFLLSAGVGVGASVAGAALAHAIDGPLVSLAGRLGYDESKARAIMDAKGGEVLKEGFANAFRGLSTFLGHQGKTAATGVTDPHEFFLGLEVQLREFALALAQAKKVHGAWNRSDVKNPLAATGSKATPATGLAGFAKDSNIDALASDPFWKFVFEADANHHKERWAVVRSMIAVAMRRLAWSLYCRAQWRNLTWDYTVKVNRDAEFRDSGANPSDWKSEPVEEWPYKAWSSNMGWPAHFADSIVPDFAGWEHDPGHAVNAALGGNEAKAGKLQKRVAHFSLAVYMCCQVRPERGKDAIDPMADGASALLTQYMRDGSLDDYRKFRAMRAEVNVAEVRFGDARIGSTSGKKGRMTGPAPFDKPYRLAIVPKAITVVVASTGRTLRKAHLRLLGPFETNAVAPTGLSAPTLPSDADVVATATESLSLTAGGKHDWHGLPLARGKRYCVVLEAREQSAKSGAATYAEDPWFFEVPG